MIFDDYELDPAIFDEMFLPDGAPREHCLGVYEALVRLSGEDLANIQDRVTRSFSNEGITFTVYGDEEADERIIPIDCLPRVMARGEWLHLEAGLTQRLKALNRFLEDVYNEARIVEDGVIPVEVVRGCPQYRTEMRGFSIPNGTWVAICGTDLVRTGDGFSVLEDNLRVPSGVSYMLANRKAAKASLRRLYRESRVKEVEHYGKVLLETLRELAPKGALESDHRPLDSRGLQLRLLRAYFPCARTGRRAGGGTRPSGQRRIRLHAHHFGPAPRRRGLQAGGRRLHRSPCLPLGFPPGGAGVDARLQAGQREPGQRAGTGVADDKSVYAYVPDMIRYYLAEGPFWEMSKPVSAAGRRTWNTPWTTCRIWWSSASASPEATGC